MGRFKLSVQHHFNPMHFYCSLLRIGVDRRIGLGLSRFYEKTVFRILKPIIS